MYERLGRTGTLRGLRKLQAPLLIAAGIFFLGGAVMAASAEHGRASIGSWWVKHPKATSGPVAFSMNHFAGTTAVTEDGEIWHAIQGQSCNELYASTIGTVRSGCSPMRRGTWTVTERLVGSRTRPTGAGATVKVNWYRPELGGGNVLRTTGFSEVDLGEAWRGIHVRLRATGRNVERIFTVLPGADPRAIQIELTGLQDMAVASDGSLELATPLGVLAWSPPVAFQLVEGNRRVVEARYRVLGAGRVGFELGDFDREQPVVIDPYLSSTFVGGTNADTLVDVIRIGGFYYAVGTSESPTLAPWSSGFQGTLAGSRDLIVARLQGTSGSPLDTVSFFGGTGTEEGVAIGSDGALTPSIFVVGNTTSSDLPATSGSAQPTYGGGVSDAFVVKFSADLTTAVATYLGGGNDDFAGDLTVDSSGRPFVVGWTDSNDFPAVAGGGQPTRSAGFDGFVSRISGNLASVEQSTFLGGSGNDYLTALGLESGTVYVAGRTESADFPAVSGGAQGAIGAPPDGVVAKLADTLTAPSAQASFFGGNGFDATHGIALTNLYVVLVGETNSTDLPTDPSVLQPSFSGGPTDAFVARLSKSLTSNLLATYFGGNGTDVLHDVASSASALSDVVVAVGQSGSTTLPAVDGGVQRVPSLFLDGMLVRIDAGGLTPASAQSTFFGGTQADELRGVWVYSDLAGLDRVVAVGASKSPTLPGGDFAAQSQNAQSGVNDGFLADLPGTLQFSCPPEPVAGCHSATVSRLLIRDKAVPGPDPNKRDVLSWSWLGSGTSTSFEDFGNPMILGRKTEYVLCVYDYSGSTPFLKAQLKVTFEGTCGTTSKPCWNKVPKKGAQTGFQFRDPLKLQNGVGKLLLKRDSSSSGKDQIKLKGTGAGLSLPGPFSVSEYFSVDPKLVVQFLKSDGGRCWSVEMLGGTVNRNTPELLRASCGGKRPACQ